MCYFISLLVNIVKFNLKWWHLSFSIYFETILAIWYNFDCFPNVKPYFLKDIFLGINNLSSFQEKFLNLLIDASDLLLWYKFAKFMQFMWSQTQVFLVSSFVTKYLQQSLKFLVKVLGKRWCGVYGIFVASFRFVIFSRPITFFLAAGVYRLSFRVNLRYLVLLIIHKRAWFGN